MKGLSVKRFVPLTILRCAVSSLGIIPIGMLAPTWARAQDAVTMDGNITCGDYVQYYEGRASLMAENFQLSMVYAEGFISGVDLENSWRGGPQVAGHDDRNARALYFYNFCTKRPLESFVAAVGSYVHTLWPQWRWPVSQ
jgi:hypothetical protein